MDLEIAFMQELQEERFGPELLSGRNFGEQSLTVFSLMLDAYLRTLRKNSGENFLQIQCGQILYNGIQAHYESKYEEEYGQKGLKS